MQRQPNTDNNGKKFSNAIKKRTWDEAATITGHPPDIWRRDAYGHVINWQEYGNSLSEYGWEITHISPVADGGTDEPHNLQVIHWKANKEKDRP